MMLQRVRFALVAGVVVLAVLAFPQATAQAKRKGPAACSLKGHKLFGKVKVVTAFPDLKVQVVDAFPDLNVKVVDNFPDKCGEWKMVDAFPDLKIQFVTAFPDLKIKYVTAFAGMP